MTEGLLLAQRYLLVAKLGQGGMGSVWRAKDLTLGAEVAVKLIDPSITSAPDVLPRFRREAQAAAALRSTHVVQTLDYGIDQGQAFIAMELLEGESLAARLRRVGKLSPSDTALILSQVAKALARAHERGIVHRDLKPENIFLVRDGADEIAKVLDFGVAKQTQVLDESTGLRTQSGVVLGTPFYMSPEQAIGKSDVDYRTDLWAFGVIAYECITGTRPFHEETLAALLLAICGNPPPPPSCIVSVPPGFDDWCVRAMAREPAMRFASVIEAASRLAAICSGVSTGATPVSPDRAAACSDSAMGQTVAPASVTLSPSQRCISRRRRVAITSVALAAVGVTTVGFTLRHRAPADASVTELSSGLVSLPSVPIVPAVNTGTVTAQVVSSAEPVHVAQMVSAGTGTTVDHTSAAQAPLQKKPPKAPPPVAGPRPAPLVPRAKPNSNQAEDFGF